MHHVVFSGKSYPGQNLIPLYVSHGPQLVSQVVPGTSHGPAWFLMVNLVYNMGLRGVPWCESHGLWWHPTEYQVVYSVRQGAWHG